MLQAGIDLVCIVLGLTVLTVINIVGLLKKLYWGLYTQVWDVQLHIANQFARDLNPKAVIPAGRPGANGEALFLFTIIL